MSIRKVLEKAVLNQVRDILISEELWDEVFKDNESKKPIKKEVEIVNTVQGKNTETINNESISLF